MTAQDAPELPEFLDRLSRALLEATERARTLRGRAVTPEALARWSHSLREPLTVIAAWVPMLGQDRDATSRGREAMARNARVLLQRLAEPPV